MKDGLYMKQKVLWSIINDIEHRGKVTKSYKCQSFKAGDSSMTRYLANTGSSSPLRGFSSCWSGGRWSPRLSVRPRSVRSSGALLLHQPGGRGSLSGSLTEGGGGLVGVKGSVKPGLVSGSGFFSWQKVCLWNLFTGCDCGFLPSCQSAVCASSSSEAPPVYKRMEEEKEEAASLSCPWAPQMDQVSPLCSFTL